MSIAAVQPLSAGNALRLFIEPPPGAVRWRVLRKGSDTFAGHDDQSALVVYEGSERVVLDVASLPNDVMAFYRPFYSDGSAWTAGATAYGTPSATFEEQTTDVMSLVRQRLEAGLKVEVDRGNLINELGYVQVYTAPPSLEQNLLFPLVTLTLEDESPEVRGIGEYVGGDEFEDWGGSEGWMANVHLSIVGWSLNSDERVELRKALRRIIIANLPVFSAHGIEQVNVTMSDVDAISGEYGAPIYQVMANLTCIAPVRVGGQSSGTDAINFINVAGAFE